jgi:predicted nucleotidyltransferase
MNTRIDNLRKSIAPLLQHSGVLRAGVFGSYSREDDREYSDIDILIELDSSRSLFEYIKLKHGLEDILGRNVDLVEYDALKPLLRDEILADEIRIL